MSPRVVMVEPAAAARQAVLKIAVQRADKDSGFTPLKEIHAVELGKLRGIKTADVVGIIIEFKEEGTGQ